MIVDFELDTDDRELLAVLADFADKRVRPGAADADASQTMPTGVTADIARLGLFVAVSDEYGGDGGPDRATQLLLLERVAGADAGLAFELASAMGAVAVIEAGTTPERGAPLLAPLTTDPAWPISLLYYEGFGRAPDELATAAERTADGWRLNGAKRSVVRPGAAELSVVLAAADGQLAAFVLPGSTGGVQVTRDDNAAGKLGLRSAATGDVRLVGVQTPPEALLGAPGAVDLHRAVAWFRLATAAIAIGVGVAAIEYATRYAKERVAFGKTIIDYQGVEFPLVESDMALDAARLDVQAAWADVTELADAGELARRTSAAYGVATAAATTATLTSVNTLGGHGYLADHPVERWYRDATTLSAIDFDPLMHTGAIA